MNETQVRTLAQVRQVLQGTEALQFQRPEDDAGRYAWIESVSSALATGNCRGPTAVPCAPTCSA